MNTVNRTALANLKQNKGKNILIGIAIFLTTIMVFVIPTAGLGQMDLNFAAVNKAYPTYHVMYRNVDQKTADDLAVHADIEEVGLRQDAAEIVMPEGMALMVYMDQNALELSKIRLKEGSWPKEAEDIVVSRGLLDELGISAGIGDEISLPYQPEEPDGLGYEQSGVFRVCGFVESSPDQQEKKVYSSLVSKEFMEQTQPEDTRKYRVMLRVKTSPSMTTDDIEDVFKQIGENFGIPDGDIVENGEYLSANYVDPSLYTGIVLILLVVVLAGAVTLYSIYYISMIYKVQEFGKLKALGATKGQIRQIVFREGMLVTCIAAPLGLLAGTGISIAAIRYMVSAFGDEHPLQSIMNGILKESGGMILKPWIYLLTLAVVFLTVALSLLRPMQVAAQISPVEAMRYDGSLKTKKKERKGHEELNLMRLTGANLSRNKKRTVITIVTLSLTGILFMTVSSILACVDPKEIARDAIREEMVISVESTTDKMHPELAWSQICQDNPLNEDLEQEITGVPGVEGIQKQSYVRAGLPEVMEDESYWDGSIIGIPESYAKELENSALSGSDFTYEELLAGDKIIMDKNMYQWVPEFKDKKPGDKIKMLLEDGTQRVEKEFEIAGVCDVPPGISFYCAFAMPEETLKNMCSYNMSYYWSVSVEEGLASQAEEQIKELVETDERLKIRTYEEELEYQEKTSGFMSQICYTFLVILGAVGIMNLVNTMINSIYVRRRELGIMQAIGLSEKQMVRMLQMEGVFYTAGTLVMSLSLGGIIGYAAYWFAKKDGMFGIVSYHYPAAQTVILVAVIAVIQILLTYLITKNFRKQSMIERIRFSE